MKTKSRRTGTAVRLLAGLLLASLTGTSAGGALAPDRFVADITAKLRAYQQQARAGTDSAALDRTLIIEEVVVHFDFQALATAAMGGFWFELSDGERRCVAKAIRERVIDRYTDYLVDFDYAGLQSTSTDPMREGFLVTVSQRFKTENPQPLLMRYELDPRGETWKVTDVAVDGVSLAASYRKSFYEQIEQDGIGDFLRTFPACRDR